MRGIAAIAVLLYHFFYNEHLTATLGTTMVRTLTDPLQHGVSLFFVLSGFVITRILLNTKKEKNYFSHFYHRRILRIFPLYYLYLLVTYYIYPFIAGTEIPPFVKQLPYFLFLQNLSWLTGLRAVGPTGHYWTLAVEEHFYLIWPLLVWVLPTKYLRFVIFSVILLILPLKYYFLQADIDITHNTFTRFDQLLFGALLALIERDRVIKNIKTIKFSNILGLTILIFLLGFIVYSLRSMMPVLKEILKYNILSLFFFLLLYLLIFSEKLTRTNRLLEGTLFQYLGKISYGIYVWHPLILLLIIQFLPLNWIFLNLVIAIIATIIVAHFSYYYFEKYFFKFK